MNTYFVRHTEILDIDDATREGLIRDRVIAIHYPKFRNRMDAEDNASLNLDDYTGDTGARRSLKALLILSKKGGYVVAAYNGLPTALVGIIRPQPIAIRFGVWGNRNEKRCGQKAILKTLALEHVSELDAMTDARLRPRPAQGTISRWHTVGDAVKLLFGPLNT